MTTQAEDRKAANEWDDYVKALRRATVVDFSETEDEKMVRMDDLEKPGNEEKWNNYYFPNYCYAAPMPWHTANTKRILYKPEWYEVMVWSRELAKTARTMMNVIRLSVTKKKRSILYISNSETAAIRLLKPIKLNLENNQRLINDYGKQETFGDWSEKFFLTKLGCAFLAVGAGQTPRGARNEEVRPDVVVMDDFDTDEDCRNPETIDKKWEWFEQAVYATRSISNPMLVIFCGNIIGEHCCIKKAMEMADHASIINIRDEDGKSTWPNKNTEALIERALSKISYASQQKEYYNNPVTNGKVFKEVHYGKMRPLKEYKFLVTYCDPSYKKKGDYKAVVLIGRWKDEYHLITVYCQQSTTSEMIDWHYEIAKRVNGTVPVYYYVEWPWIDDPLKLEIEASNIRHGFKLPLKPDERDKPDKYHRIESSLEPLNRNGKLIFNEQLKGNVHMVNMEAQFLALSPTSRAHDDGPDAVEGGVFIVNLKTSTDASKTSILRKPVNPKRY